MPEFMTFPEWRKVNRDLEEKLLDGIHVSGITMRQLIDIEDMNGGESFAHDITELMLSMYKEQKVQDQFKFDKWTEAMKR